MTSWTNLAGSLLAVLMPLLFLRYVIAKFLFGAPGSAYLSAVMTAPFGIWISWHAGMVDAQVFSFSPFWGLIPVFLTELQSLLQTRLNLQNDCSESHGNRYVMPN